MEIINNYDEALNIAKPYIEHLKESETNYNYENKNVVGLPLEIQNTVWQMSEKALINTLKYLFEKLHHSCYMLCIANAEYKIYKLEMLDVAPTFKNALETIHQPALKTNPLITEQQRAFITKQLKYPARILQCILKKQYSAKSTTMTMTKPNEYDNVLSGLQLPNGVFILNLTDAIILTTDGTEPFPTVTRSLPLGDYNFNEYLPIMSMSGANGYRDIPIPNYDDIAITYNTTLLTEFDKFKTGWEAKKIVKAVFRGGPSGCGYTAETNMRIKLVLTKFIKLDMKYLDVALIGIGDTIDSNAIKFDPIHGLGMLNTGIPPGNRISMLEQSNYKYIIHIDGNVNAYRLLTTMRTGSLILRVKSEYRSWVDHLIKPDEHYIEINADLSNLEERITWCLKNNAKCKAIAQNGLKFATMVLQISFIKSYMQKILWALSPYHDKDKGNTSASASASASADNAINIQLGDILLFIAPNNEKYDKRQFYVKYIDTTKIVLVDLLTQQASTITVKLIEQIIQGIELLSRAEHPGYALQNNLEPGVWINIYFRGSDGVPFIMTGVITDLEQDSIEITTYPDKDIIYIDFEYKGLPETLPIEKIVITSKPETGIQDEAEQVEGEREGLVGDESDEFGIATNVDEEKDYTKLNAILIDADLIQFGEDLEEITITVEVAESEKRFGIESQTSDLLDELLSDVPNYKRTFVVLNAIHTMIERYTQLRSIYSKFDGNRNANIPDYLQDDFKPIIANIIALNKNYDWLLPVSYNTKKLYDLNSGEADNDDVGIESVTANFTQKNEDEINDAYKNNTFHGDENKYVSLYKSLNKLYTPFSNPINAEHNILQQTVNTNILSIIDNLGDLESYIAKAVKIPKEPDFIFIAKKFLLMEVYTIGLTYQKDQHLTPLTASDQISIKSILTLTLPMLFYSRIKLPTTNVLERSQLNNMDLVYWKLLNKNTKVRALTIDNFANGVDANGVDANGAEVSNDYGDEQSDVGYESDADDRISEFKATFLRETRHYMLDEGLLGEPNKYEQFLDKIIPTNSQIFNILKTHMHISNNLSFYSVIKFLEVFSIYPRDINASFYKEIKEFIMQNITDYKTTLVANYNTYRKLTTKIKSKSVGKKVIKTDSILDILSSNQSLETIVLSAYKLEKDQYYSNSEILTKILHIDYGRLFYMALVKINMDLQVTTLVENFVNRYEQMLKSGQSLNPNSCKTIGKKYSTRDELLNDNYKLIYFDSQYDKTNYSVLNKLKRQREELNPEEFKVLLTTMLTKSANKSKKSAITLPIEENLVEEKPVVDEQVFKDVNTLLAGKKRIENGDYAILFLPVSGPSMSVSEPSTSVSGPSTSVSEKTIKNITDTIKIEKPSLKINKQQAEYYMRKDDVWILDTEIISDNVVVDDNKLFCALQKDCIVQQTDSTCVSLDTVEKKLDENMLQSIYSEFDKTYGDDEANLRQDIENNLLLSIERVKLLNIIEKSGFFKYDTMKRILSNSIADEEETSIPLIVSPYEKLRNKILGQTDIIKRQYDIQKMVLHFARLPYTTEDHYWMYCIKTGVKLVPRFLSELADIYVSGNIENYLYKIDLICTEQGTISEDGDAWVDKHSGYIIKKIDLATEEGFTEEGFKLKTREVLEADLGNAILEGKGVKAIESVEYIMIRHIVMAVSRSLGVDLKNEIEFIIENVISLHKSVTKSKKDYEKIIIMAKEKGKTIPSYEDNISEFYLIITFIFIVIAIQVSIPNIKSRIPFPGCKESFYGYPLMGEDKAAIIYIACVAHKMKSMIAPWNAISNLKQDGIVKRMEAIIDKYKVAQKPNIIERTKEKNAYLKIKNIEMRMEDIDKIKLLRFFPPLVPFKITHLVNILPNFKQDLFKNIKTGALVQQDQILIIKSKVMKYGLAIQGLIKTVVDKKPPLITSRATVPYLENACCDSISINVYKYLVDNEPLINTYNGIVEDLSKTLDDVYAISKPPLFYDITDTKYKYPEVDTYFSEDTIYKAFIIFCKDKDLDLSPDLLEVCRLNSEKSENIETIESKIAKLKEEGVNYGEELLHKLLTIVNLKNSLNIDLTNTQSDSIEMLNKLLQSGQEQQPSRFLPNIELVPEFVPDTSALNASTSHVALNSSTSHVALPQEFIRRFKIVLDTYSIERIKSDNDSIELRRFKEYLGDNNEQMSNRIDAFIKSNLKLNKTIFANFKNCYSNITTFIESNGTNDTIYKMMRFINNTISDMTELFPNIIINQVDNTSVNIPTHWNLSHKHVFDLKKIINEYYIKLKPFYDNKILNNVLMKIQTTVTTIKLFAKYTPFYSPFKKYRNEVISVFDSRLVTLLFKYYFLMIITNYIDLIDDPAIFFKQDERQQQQDDERQQQDKQQQQQDKQQGDDEQQDDNEDFSALNRQETIGDKKQLSDNVSEYIIAMMEIICTNKEIIDCDSTMIMSKILRSKETEKDKITKTFKNLSEEERRAENELKNHKLGKWGKGLQKGLTQYVQATYDEERDEMDQEQMEQDKIEQQAIINLILASQEGVTDENRNIYQTDMEDDERIDQEIANDEYNLDNLLDREEFGNEFQDQDDDEY